MALKKYHVSANLFNKSTALANTAVSDSSGNTFANSGTNASDYINVSGMTKISITNTLASRWAAFYDTNKAFVSGSNGYGVINVPENAAYLRITVTNAFLDSCMVNEGETLLPYEPYGNTWNDIPYRRYETATDAVTNLPVEIFTDGQPVTSWTMKGNTQTSGTPSPQNPVTIQGVGNETANLFSGWIIGKKISSADGSESSDEQAADTDYIPFETDETYTVSGIDPNLRSFFSGYNAQKEYLGRTTASERSNITLTKNSFTLGTPQGTGDVKYLRCCIAKALQSQPDISDINNYNTMLNVGSTALPYEPNGYKISILKDLSPLTPIYVSQQLMKYGTDEDTLDSSGLVTRTIYKYVLTGQENITLASGNAPFIVPLPVNITSFTTQQTKWLCTHYPSITPAATWANYDYLLSANTNVRTSLRFRDIDYSTVDDFKAFLAQEYTNGTPVTIYYVLETPTTETVTVPTITTTGGEVTIDVDTTVKPSELDLTYHGWHSHEPLKRENGQWV